MSAIALYKNFAREFGFIIQRFERARQMPQPARRNFTEVHEGRTLLDDIDRHCKLLIDAGEQQTGAAVVCGSLTNLAHSPQAWDVVSADLAAILAALPQE